MRFPGTTVRRGTATLALVGATALIAATASPAVAGTEVKPGPTSTPATLTAGFTLSGFDVATNRSGTGYVGWIANSKQSDPATRAVHLCTVQPGTTTCAGGVQVVDSLGDSSAEGLRVLVQKSGVVDLVWFYEGVDGGHIGLATTTSGGTLRPGRSIGSAPDNGSLLDAELAPGGTTLWTVAGPSSGDGIQVRAGDGAATTVATPYTVGYAELAFTGATPVIATQQGGAITKPAGYTFESRGSWSAVHNVAHTWSTARLGLADTRSGLRLIATEDNAGYSPVVARWTGKGFAAPTLTGDHNHCAPSSHDTVADSSGRLADVSYECETIAVANLPDTSHAAVTNFSAHGTINAGDPRMATTPRGHAFVIWSVESGTSDRLLLAPVLLADTTRTTDRHVAAGTVSVTGPVSCLPPDEVHVGVSARPTAGWRINKTSLTLDGRSLGSTLEGANLTAGKAQAIVGTARFTKKGISKVATATLRFRACPKP